MRLRRCGGNRLLRLPRRHNDINNRTVVPADSGLLLYFHTPLLKARKAALGALSCRVSARKFAVGKHQNIAARRNNFFTLNRRFIKTGIKGCACKWKFCARRRRWKIIKTDASWLRTAGIRPYSDVICDPTHRALATRLANPTLYVRMPASLLMHSYLVAGVCNAWGTASFVSAVDFSLFLRFRVG